MFPLVDVFVPARGLPLRVRCLKVNGFRAEPGIGRLAYHRPQFHAHESALGGNAMVHVQKLALITLLLACSATGRAATLSNETLVGTWECGPTTMRGPNFDVAVTSRTTYDVDYNFSSHTTSVITPDGQPAITNQDVAHGTWRMEGHVITSKVERVRFLSSSDPGIIIALGQQIQDDQLKTKSVYKSRVIAFDGTTSRSIPVDALHKEAVVETSCRRL